MNKNTFILSFFILLFILFVLMVANILFNHGNNQSSSSIILLPSPTKIEIRYPFNDTASSGALESENAYLLTTKPDVYLANRVPFENDAFKIVSEYKSNPQPHFAFIVTSKVQGENVRNRVQMWLLNNSLTSSQAASLEIVYR